MLAIIVFRSFRDANGRKACFQHGCLVATPAEPVGSIDHSNMERAQILLRQTRHVAVNIARRTVHLAAIVATLAGLGGGLHGLGAFGEDADIAGLRLSALTVTVADDVVVQVSLDHPTL